LKKDAEKEAIKEKERQQKEEEELFAKLQEALAEHNQQEKEAEKAKQREKLVPSEPGEKETNNVTQLQIRMPDGSKILRRFRQDETLQIVMNFVVTTPNLDLNEKNVILSSPPNQTFNDLTKTLKELNLFPRAVLVVQKK